MSNKDKLRLTVIRPKFFYGYVIVAAALFMSIVMWGARLSFGVFFSPVLEEFGWTRAATSGGFSLTWVFTGLLSIVVGRLNDKFGPRLIMTIAGFLVGLGYLFMSTIEFHLAALSFLWPHQHWYECCSGANIVYGSQVVCQNESVYDRHRLSRHRDCFDGYRSCG